MNRIVAAFLAILAVFSVVLPAAAHTRSESHTSWTIDGRFVRMDFTLADTEAARVSRGARPNDQQLLHYLEPRVGVSSEGVACKSVAPARPISAAPGFRRYEFQYGCPTPNKLRLIDRALFELVPSHVNLAQIQRADGDFVEQIISGAEQGVDLKSLSGDDLGSASLLRFIEMGVMHIFTGIDHMSFLLGLVLISRRLRDLIYVVTGFTLGHSLTLALAVTGIIRPHAEFIDALVALTIALIGAENIAVASGRPRTVAIGTGVFLGAIAVLRLFGIGLLPPLLLVGSALFAVNYLLVTGHLRDAARLRLVVTLVFGLIHGFGFAADILQSRLPPEKLAEILVGFNLGVEVGQLTVILVVTSVVALMWRMRLTLPRPIVVDASAASLVAAGTYWFVSRSFA